MSNIGLGESTFRININTAAPNLTSSTHTPGTWSTNHNQYFTWSMPTADSNYQGVRYVLDHYANTVPTSVAGTFIPTTNGTANGQISWINNGTAQTIAGATVTINRGLFTSTATASDGKYNLPNVPAGTWEATAPGFNPVTKTITITGNLATTTDFQLTKM